MSEASDLLLRSKMERGDPVFDAIMRGLANFAAAHPEAVTPAFHGGLKGSAAKRIWCNLRQAAGADVPRDVRTKIKRAALRRRHHDPSDFQRPE